MSGSSARAREARSTKRSGMAALHRGLGLAFVVLVANTALITWNLGTLVATDRWMVHAIEIRLSSRR